MLHSAGGHAVFFPFFPQQQSVAEILITGYEKEMSSR